MNTLRKFLLIIPAAVMALSLACCSDDDDAYSTIETVDNSYSTLVKNFKLKANRKVLVSLDTVFFSIDQINARIFNADSLPYGTDVSKLVVNITTQDCRTVELTMRKNDGNDTIINYLTNSTDSINFANGPVKLHVVSRNGQAERSYLINVNVHKMVSDSLYWNRLEMRALPTASGAPVQQKTVQGNGEVFTLTRSSQGSFSMAVTTNPEADAWVVKTVRFGFTPNIESFTANSAGKLFILDTAGNLHTSADNGATWTDEATATPWYSIIGNYQEAVLGVRYDNGNWYHTSFPAGSKADDVIPADFPIDGHSTSVLLSTKWSTSPQLIVFGGAKADGSLSSDVWGYDGNSWAKYSDKFPRPLSGATMFNYKVAKTDSTTWKVSEIDALIVVGGRSSDATINPTTYISRDMGLTWRASDALLRLPAYITPRYGAQAIVVNTTIKAGDDSRTASPWQSFPATAFPGTDYAAAARPGAPSADSRAIAPVTEWECPYVYLFGGYDYRGNLLDEIWRGVINRLTFKPLI